MVRGLIRMHLKDNASVNTVSSELRKMCPSLFSQDDYKLLKAEELLKEATETVNIESKEYLVQEAIKILLSVSSQVDISKCVKFIVKLRFYKEAVQFCIRLGEKLDPGHLADMYIDQPKTALTNDRVEEAVQKIRQCYSSISYILLELNKEVNNKANALASEDVRHDIITTIIRTSSKAGLYKLYEDAIMRDDEFLMKYFQVDEFRDYLLWFIGQVDCPKHFEKLLDVQRSATNGHEYMAQLLYDKALDHKWTVDMDTRIFWLSQAIVFIQSGTKSTQQMKSMMAIKEALECAELQNFVARELELFCSDLSSRITDEFDHDELNCAKQVLHDLKRYIWPINDIITKVTNRFTIPLANLIIYKSIIGGNIQMEEICNHWDVILQDCFKYYKLKKETSEQTCSRIINLLKRIERAPAMNTAYLPKIHIVLRLIDFFILEKFSPSRVIDFCYNSIISLDGLVDAIGHTIKNEGYDNHEDIPVLRYLLQIIFELSEAFVSGQLHMASERKQKLGRKLLDIFATSQLAVQRLNITDFKYLSPITGSSNPFVFYSKEVKMTLNS
uniref:TPR_REGION domain-containing protein n=1 Tax=Parastrongyloides trichosuri TaxID=131310 RepID=A0A0N4ZML1_PARTI